MESLTQIKGESVNHDYLYNHQERELYGGIIPRGGLILTCGIDIQGDRGRGRSSCLGRNKQSFSVDYRVFYGDIGRDKFKMN